MSQVCRNGRVRGDNVLFIYTLHYTELYIKWVPGFDKSHYDRTCNNKEGITVSDLFLLYYSIV